MSLAGRKQDGGLREAVAVILSRPGRTGIEVLLVRRSPELRFFGGHWAFPGGTFAEADRRDTDASVESAIRRCAVRELFEETGLRVSADAGFRTVCDLTTPEFFRTRYATRFLHLDFGGGDPIRVDGSEIVEARFFQPAEIVSAWERGEEQIAPPVLFLLKMFNGRNLDTFVTDAGRMAAEIEAGRLHDAWFSPGIFVAPLRTPTLPPATTTNTLVVGIDSLYIVDPATPETPEQERLFSFLDERVAGGVRIEAILLTHHHEDHVGAVNAVSNRYRVPVRAHALTYDRIPSGFIRGAPVSNGEVMQLGRSPDGRPGWTLTAIHTPGHAVDHLCYFENRYHALIAGDMLSTQSTIIIDPPEGHMRTYLDSLEGLLGFPVKTLYPSHGAPHGDGKALIREYLAHRRKREQRLAGALGDEPVSLDELLPAVYSDVPEAVYPLARRSLLAGLIKLLEDGVCEETGGAWRRRPDQPSTPG